MKIKVVLNGTDQNPYHSLGLSSNPFPQPTLDARASRQLQVLAGDPIPNTNYIRNHLQGWSTEFVDLCCRQFKKGERVEFYVQFPD